MKERTPQEEALWWLGVLGGTAGTGLFVWGVLKMPKENPQKPQKSQKPETRQNGSSVLGPVWPIAARWLQRIGDTVMPMRGERPHKGVDLFAPAGTPVLSAVYGRVLRVIDGREGGTSSLKRAGLFVDVRGIDGRIYRYLHLSRADVREGQPVRAGEALGTVSRAGESGVEHSDPHIHFEIRAGDWDRGRRDYGEPVDPLKVLPPRTRVT